jgi:S-adenosylmethionine synthetase
VIVPDIAQGVDAADNKDEGAGDQGIMFGYATDETPELMPAPILYSHKILKAMAEARHSGAEPRLGPDAKSQVTVEYRDGKPVRVDTIVVSTQHLDPTMDSAAVREMIEPICGRSSPRVGSTPRPCGTSTRQAVSSSAGRTATPA